MCDREKVSHKLAFRAKEPANYFLQKLTRIFAKKNYRLTGRDCSFDSQKVSSTRSRSFATSRNYEIILRRACTYVRSEWIQQPAPQITSRIGIAIDIYSTYLSGARATCATTRRHPRDIPEDEERVLALSLSRIRDAICPAKSARR